MVGTDRVRNVPLFAVVCGKTSGYQKSRGYLRNGETRGTGRGSLGQDAAVDRCAWGLGHDASEGDEEGRDGGEGRHGEVLLLGRGRKES